MFLLCFRIVYMPRFFQVAGAKLTPKGDFSTSFHLCFGEGIHHLEIFPDKALTLRAKLNT